MVRLKKQKAKSKGPTVCCLQEMQFVFKDPYEFQVKYTMSTVRIKKSWHGYINKKQSIFDDKRQTKRKIT